MNNDLNSELEFLRKLGKEAAVRAEERRARELADSKIPPAIFKPPKCAKPREDGIVYKPYSDEPWSFEKHGISVFFIMPHFTSSESFKPGEWVNHIEKKIERDENFQD